MTVQELIERLQALPPECRVLVEGYENGLDTLTEVQTAKVSPQQPCEDWDGEFERADPNSKNTDQCVLLVGRRGQRRG